MIICDAQHLLRINAADTEFYEMHMNRDPPPPYGAALASFWNRVWVRRIWIKQEVSLCSRVQVLCEDDSIDFDTVSECVTSMFVLNLICYIDAPELSDSTASINYILEIISLRNSRRAGRTTSIRELLVKSGLPEASDLRDKIYGFLGIADDADDSVFEPDFTRTLEKLHQNVTRHMIEKNRYFVLFCHAGISQKRSLISLPSWVPDYTTWAGVKIL